MAKYQVKVTNLTGFKTSQERVFSITQIKMFNPAVGNFLNLHQPEVMNYQTYTREYTFIKVSEETPLGEMLIV